MALPKDRSIHAPQSLSHHALYRGPQCHLTLAVQRDDLLWIKAHLSLLYCHSLALCPWIRFDC
jgi:hypothetical protein